MIHESKDASISAQLTKNVTEESRNLISGNGEMVDRVRAFAWEGTALGSISEWSPTLLALVNTVLSCPLPMQLFWGPDFVVIYNDALISALTDKHPNALGGPAANVWAEAWPIVGPQLSQVRQSGKGFYSPAALVPIQRDGAIQDVWWDYSYSPVFGTDGPGRGCS